MLNLTLAYLPALLYQRALNELHRLDDRDLDDIGIARIEFPELAWRHAIGTPPLLRPSC